MEGLDYALNYLINEDSTFGKPAIPDSIDEKEKLWRAYCNVREAKPIGDDYIKAQDKYLQERLKRIDVTDVTTIENVKEKYNCTLDNADKICLWRGDITALKADVIVNAANSRGLGCFQALHYCIDNQIQTFSGVQMRLECNEYMKTIDYNLPTGDVFITKGYNLPSKYVIHTVGPIIQLTVTEREKIQLKNCYINSLKLAVEKGIKTIVFPCISTGVFRFPKEDAATIAINAVNEFLDNNDSIDRVIFNVYGEEDLNIYERLFRKS